ncbi:metallophosphoesterase [Waterburya agarophytonicola K14]|uniref:Metallophosphoesterase n=1 Tax=Waterburya agarophytonicola KI4 TaxID=2874699 RepID=A0A964BRE1_9CYAN|nr:metallophosphoesterase [Waterburya agarophytonicola]MCC0176435.1 metallophosphoesterase [Waterburya agarophytonicola KI4]
MKFVRDPDISVKIHRMKRRVRWQDDPIKQRAIAQTKLVIDQEDTDNPNFSFTVIGDSGCGSHLKHHPQRKIAEMILQQDDSSFLLHTGDVIYQVGSREYYPQNFIDPYQEFLVGGENSSRLKYDSLTFKSPFFLVPGNHDYYDLPLISGILAQATWLPRRLLRGRIDLDVGWYGSDCGDAYARAFLNYLADLKDQSSLKQYLDDHYTANHTGDRCLHYQPGKFTRLPNRYYTFRYGGIDFFALDSNTFNQPLAIPDTEEGESRREKLLTRQRELENREQKIQESLDRLDRNNPEDLEEIDDYYAKLEHISESQRDINKQLNKQNQATDWEQLEWLKDSLVASWQDEAARGRIIFLHHPPYVTETTKWNQGQTLAVRDRLRQVFDDAAKEIGALPEGRSLVDIVLSGHAHCLEYLYTKETGHGDSYTNWIVCGGSGHSLRRQRHEGTVLYQDADLNSEPIGQSHLYVGRSGSGRHHKRPYSFLRIDVEDGDKPRFTINPFVAEWHQRQWHEYAIDSFEI